MMKKKKKFEKLILNEKKSVKIKSLMYCYHNLFMFSEEKKKIQE